MDRYPARRSPDRERGRYPPTADSYVPASSRAPRPRSPSPGGYRRRSRSPLRAQGDNWRGRPRSPSRRYDSRPEHPGSQRGFAPADNRLNDGYRAPRARSPLHLKRSREHSPAGRPPRSPPAPKRERLGSPPREYARARSPRRGYSPMIERGNYRPRSRSPRRDIRPDTYDNPTWRRHSPSPRAPRMDDRGADGSAMHSHVTSRRSSPRAYNREPIPVDTYDRDMRGPVARPRSPDRRSPPRFRDENDSYDGYRRGEEYQSNGNEYAPRDLEISATTPEYRADRAPPTGPSGSRYGPSPGMSPPLGPSTTTPLSIPSHNRPPSTSSYGPPTHPRGGYRGRGGPPTPREYPAPLPRRGSAYGSSPYGRGRGGSFDHPSRGSYSYESQRPQPSHYGPPQGSRPPAFRGSSNSTSTTYPRTQRFDQHLADLPKVKPGGEKLPPLHDTTKADKLEEEAARLRKLIDEKEAVKRQGLRTWESMEREASTAALRSELAEEHLRSLNGESEGMGAAF